MQSAMPQSSPKTPSRSRPTRDTHGEKTPTPTPLSSVLEPIPQDAFLMIPQGRQTRTLDIPLDRGPQIYEAKRGEPLKVVKPYTEEVRRTIDWELVDHGIDFMTRQKAAGKPFFLYLPISRTHFPNLPSKRFEGQSRIGQFGDSLMECDAIVGRMLDTLDELGIARDTIVVFASDNGPEGPGVRSYAGDMQDMGYSGPYRGTLGA